MSQIGQRRRKLERFQKRIVALRKSLLTTTEQMMSNLDAPSLSLLREADMGLLYALQCIVGTILYINSAITAEDLESEVWVQEVMGYLEDYQIL